MIFSSLLLYLTFVSKYLRKDKSKLSPKVLNRRGNSNIYYHGNKDGHNNYITPNHYFSCYGIIIFFRINVGY